MRTVILAALLAGLFLFCPPTAPAQSAPPRMSVGTQVISPCDLNYDGVVNLLDIQAAVNMAVGQATCTASVTNANLCDIVMVQRVTNAAITGNCITGVT